MLTLRHVRQTRAFLSPCSASTTALLLFSTVTSHPYPFSSAYPFSPNPTTSKAFLPEIHQEDLVYYFRERFMSKKEPVFDRIFEILRTLDNSSWDSALSRFNLSLSETLVLEVLNYQKKDVHSCVKFFDWAGRQPGFHHTRATFNAIFRILSNAKLMDLMREFLQNYMKQRYVYKVRYYNILVIGYAIAGKSETALQLFGRMRFQGVDLDAFAYNVLMNSLVEEGRFDVVETIAKEIRMRGLQNEVTHSIMMKNFCKQNELERGEEYLRGLVEDNDKQLSGIAFSTFIAALCKDNQFERAALLIEQFRKMDLVLMEHAYSVWIRDLAKAEKLDLALEFLKDKQTVEEYVPDVFRYNTLICRLLRENRVEEVYDLLVEMKEKEILPDDVTMNYVLCFLCKAGMMDVAMDLYDSRVDLGLSVNCMAYNYLINTLLGDFSVDEACRVMKNAMEQGYFLGEKTFTIIADALGREGKFDKMKELVNFMLENQNIMPKNFTYDKFILALCRARRIDEGYLLLERLNRLNKATQKSTYLNLISEFSNANRGNIAAKLLIGMQERGYSPSRRLVREVICCLCRTDDSEKHLFGLLAMMQQARSQLSDSEIYKFFIDGAGHARRPDLANQVYERMSKSDLLPDFTSDILVLQSYLKSERIALALEKFSYLSKRWQKRTLWHTMIVGLCKVKKPKKAVEIFEDMKKNRITPSIECFEELIKSCCDSGQYDKAVDLVNDMTQIGRPVSSFIGNIFLLHGLKTNKLYDAWVDSSLKQNLTPNSRMLGQLVGVFSGCIIVKNIEEIEKLIEQCFRMDTFTVNMLLKRLSCMNGMDFACGYFDRLWGKGYQPNKWTYDIIVRGLAKDRRNEEARKWMEEMLRKGFHLTDFTQKLIQNQATFVSYRKVPK